MRFFTSSDSSCLSERRYRFRRCWLMRSARLGVLVFFLLSRLAHCMLFLRRSGCSDWSLPVEFLWAVFSFQDSLRSRWSSQSSTDTWDCSAWKQVVNRLTVLKVAGRCFHCLMAEVIMCTFFLVPVSSWTTLLWKVALSRPNYTYIYLAGSNSPTDRMPLALSKFKEHYHFKVWGQSVRFI